jgi:DNA-binding MltR family transcriptional regulator
MGRGGSRGQKKPSLYDLSRQHVRPEDRDEYIKELLGGSDRAAALVAAADVEAFLPLLIRLKVTRLDEAELKALFFERNAPLGEFAARTLVAYGLGVIDAGERDDLNIIRRVRNVFAHSVAPVTFEHELIAQECSHLSYRETVPREMELTYGQPKLRYVITAISLKTAFGSRIVETVKKQADSLGEFDRARFLAELNAVMRHEP